MARRLALDPKLAKLATDLGLTTRGRVLDALREYGLTRVRHWIDETPVRDMEALRRLVSSKVSVKTVLIRDAADVQQVASEFADFHPALASCLRLEFLEGETEGLTVEREQPAPGFHRYLAVIDARGSRGQRAYFTLWHELCHLILHPPQLAFPGFRRAPTPDLIDRDPIEFVVDQLAGSLAFFEPFYGPAIRDEINMDGRLTFRGIAAARDSVAPDASLFAAAAAAIGFADQPTALVSVGMELKRSEQLVLASPQTRFDFATRDPEPKLRVGSVVASPTSGSRLTIRPQMRVPQRSVLAAVFESGNDVVLVAREDQNWWETSANGALPSAPLRVEAIRRGRFVYGLISALAPAA